MVFDCYGTLIDWEQGFLRGLEPLLEQKTCPDPEKVIETIGKNENRIQNENKSMLYPIVWVDPLLWKRQTADAADRLMNAYHDTSGQLRLHFDPGESDEITVDLARRQLSPGQRLPRHLATPSAPGLLSPTLRRLSCVCKSSASNSSSSRT